MAGRDGPTCPQPDVLRAVRTFGPPEPIKDWSLTKLKEKLIKIRAKVVSHGVLLTALLVQANPWPPVLRMHDECEFKPSQRPAAAVTACEGKG
jgi:hypothetical protein